MTGGVDFGNMFYVLKEGAEGVSYATVAAAKKAGAVTINYGLFINLFSSVKKKWRGETHV